MIIGIAGPYSADTTELKQQNLDNLNQAAVQVLEKGHIPLIGINAALPVIEKLKKSDPYVVMMKISLAVINNCDALLLIGESRGANMERDLILSQGKPVFKSLEDIPTSSHE